jgi:hypothetical protein
MDHNLHRVYGIEQDSVTSTCVSQQFTGCQLHCRCQRGRSKIPVGDCSTLNFNLRTSIHGYRKDS